jgi:tetratricopeptide (TPR) repeat protein
MENFTEDSQGKDLKLMTKAVDLLMTPHIGKYVDGANKLGGLKTLTFNNLACLYKKMKKFGLAVKAVSYALRIEEYMFKNEQKGEKYEIIQTYLNKAAILSQMKKHTKAMEEIGKAKKIVEMIEKELINEAPDQEPPMSEEEQKRIEEKKHYVIYMKMVINYNMGVEK